MKKAFGIMILALLFIGMILSPARTPTASAASQTSINTAITKGLAYLNSTQSQTGGSTYGSWGAGLFPVASTAMAVLAFENQGHYSWNASDPYSSTVQKGLNWLFSDGANITISNQTAGNPDTNGNGIGVYWNLDFDRIYETSMVLMAIVGSNAPTNVTSAGPLGVRNYSDIVVDIVDYLAYAQNDPSSGTYRGGWGYYENYGSSDNSNTAWPVLGLMAAELWGINAPPFVASELKYWVLNCQDLTGNPTANPPTVSGGYGSFGYNAKDSILGGVAEAASGILELTYLGVPKTNSSIIAAEGYINALWNVNDGGWNVNIGNLYGMYAVMKACREATLTPIQYIANYNGTSGVEWYNGTSQYADSLVANQATNGSWINWMPWYERGDYSVDLSTALGVLILEFVPVVVPYNLIVHVVNACTNSSIPNANVTINGPESLWNTTDGSGNAVFEMIQAGSYQVDASAFGYVPSATYAVPVTSNTIFNISLDPLPPIVIISPSNSTIAVGGSVFFTSNVSGGTAPYSYQWYLDGAPVSGATSASWTFTPTSEGLYFVSLKVTDANDNIVYSNTAQVTVITVPVGGYSVSLAKHTSSILMPAYTALISLFAAAVIVVKRKRK